VSLFLPADLNAYILPAALPFILSTAAILAAGLLQRRWIDRFFVLKASVRSP
jgi:hypothetical protein